MARLETAIEELHVRAYEIPTDAPESDGTFRWDSTTIVIVEAEAGDERGIGYSYTHVSAATLIAERLSDVVRGRDAMAVGECWEAMVHSCRNLGRPGVAATAISAVDIALWDLKARLLGISLLHLLGPVRKAIPAYGSGGFTSYSPRRLGEQLGRWVEEGMSMVKMKVGRQPELDVDRVRAARESIGPDAQLFVDANGAYDRKQALEKSVAYRDEGVTWFEEPVSSDDLAGLRLLRDRTPPGMEVTAGEYGYDLFYFRDMLEADAVDVLQADVSRCGGVTAFLRVAALCSARCMPLSAHTVPTVHAHLGCAVKTMRHVEYFHDHVRIEQLLFDGALHAAGGALHPEASRPGLGIVIKRPDAEPYEVYRCR